MIELVQHQREACILVGAITRHQTRAMVDEYLNELALLADTAGGDVVSVITQGLDRFDPATFIGKGKVDELRQLSKDKNAPTVIFDDDLSPVQVRNLERELEIKVLDRSGLILDIFASRARTMEAKTQVELAQLQYLLPRLTRQWTHLSKQFGGIGTKGPGETQIETDRRMIRTRISHLKEKLERIQQQRFTQRKQRNRQTRAALVGYTNVGKSTLLNLLSGSDVFVENRLFATLDPTTRLVPLTGGTTILMTDTVGFIRKLPPQLVASFRSTLDEVIEADIIVHMVDASHPYFEDQMRVVKETLEDLGVIDRPQLTLFNKIDALKDRSVMHDILSQHPNSVFISATRGINITGLKEAVFALLQKEFVVETIRIGQDQQKIISYIYGAGDVLEKRYEDDAVIFTVRLRKKERERIIKTLIPGSNETLERLLNGYSNN